MKMKIIRVNIRICFTLYTLLATGFIAHQNLSTQTNHSRIKNVIERKVGEINRI